MAAVYLVAGIGLSSSCLCADLAGEMARDEVVGDEVDDYVFKVNEAVVRRAAAAELRRQGYTLAKAPPESPLDLVTEWKTETKTYRSSYAHFSGYEVRIEPVDGGRRLVIERLEKRVPIPEGGALDGDPPELPDADLMEAAKTERGPDPELTLAVIKRVDPAGHRAIVEKAHQAKRQTYEEARDKGALSCD